MSARSGFALVAVLIVLVALFALAAPFLASVRNADAASARLAQDAQARLALDAAARHARAVLSSSHPAVDPTPAFDDQAELALDPRFDPAFLDPNDPRGVMWDATAEDLAGRIDLGSAPPQVFANLLGTVTRLAQGAEASDTRLLVASTAGFPARGFGWLEGELLGWSALSAEAFEPVERGLGAVPGVSAPCGPAAAVGHPPGALFLDDGAWALARWRCGPDGLRGYDAFDQLAQAARTALAGELAPDALARLARTTSPHAGVRAGARWQRPARLVSTALGEERCRLLVDDARWFNAGTTVRIEGPAGSELALVQSAREGGMELAAALQGSYETLEAVVAPLARTPVNLNSASPEVLVALFVNLQLVGESGWITPSEADELVALVRAARPLTGFEDFLRRVVLPAAGIEPPAEGEAAEALLGEPLPPAQGGFLERSDARALYRNGLNANDAELAFSTMPFTFASRDVYALELRAAVNAQSGALRTTRQRDDVQLVVPQRDLLQVWTRQSELDAATRLDGAQSGWTSGPENTLRHDRLQGFGRPAEARAHLGPYYEEAEAADPLAPPVGLGFAGSDEEGWVQLAPVRSDELDTDEHEREGRVLHFDDDPGGPEGRYLPDEPLRLSLGEPPVAWLDDEGLLAPFTFEAWFELRGSSPESRLLDLLGPFDDSDRVSLVLEPDALVLRVLGPAADHPATVFEERSEVRYPLAEGPGLPLQTWMHVALDVRGNRPDQMALLVDGRLVSEGPGLTRLASAIGLEDGLLPVRSTAGFPERCVLAIGRELVEAEVEDEETFRAFFHTEGELAGFGGRLAREIVFGFDPPTNLGEIEKGGVHAEGESVALYGYSLPIAAHVPAEAGRLESEIGPFGVARVVGVTGVPTPGEPIFLSLNTPGPIGSTNIGWGMKGADSRVTGLVLDVADPLASKEEVLAAFATSGGYAALLGYYDADDQITTEGDTLSFVEIIHYASRDGATLLIDRRGDELPELANLRGTTLTQRCAWVVDWNDGLGGVTIGGSPLAPDERMDLQTLIVPISIPAQAQGGGVGFYDSLAESDFAQLTRLGVDAGQTEWVRYDEIVGGDLVRDDPSTLLELRRVAHPTSPEIEAKFVDPGGPVIFGGGAEVRAASTASATSVPRPPAEDPQLWQSTLGSSQDDDLPLTRALRSVLRFRGVLGTFSHAHPRDTAVLPVWKVLAPEAESGGWPGRLDAVTLFDADPALPGFPGVVQHAYRPLDTVEHTWRPAGTPLSTAPGPSRLVLESGFDLGVSYVALQEPPAVPIVPELDQEGLVVGEESRRNARVTLFPSGELPRAVTELVLGGSAAGGGEVPEALVDEVVFGRPRAGIEDGGTQLVLAEALGAGASDGLSVLPDTLRTPLGERILEQGSVADLLPADAFLARIGDELLCAVAEGDGRLRLAEAGRGLGGTEPAAHAAGEPLTFLAGARVSLLEAELGADDALLALADGAGFPPQGLVRIDDELVHYTALVAGALAMPRASSEAGAGDARGPGLFRGRFGTAAAGHASGTPVLLFPCRYADRWAERADAPELASYGLSAVQPSAFWRGVFWQVEEPAAGGPRLGVLQRSRADVPWDALPRSASGLEELAGGADAADGLELGFQSDLVEWRIFARHDPGAFDPELGLSHAWKTTPRLTLFGADCFAPNVLYGSVER